MEKGTSEMSTLQELERDYGIKTYSIVNICEIIDYLYNHPIDGVIYIDDVMKRKIDDYLAKYGVDFCRS